MERKITIEEPIVYKEDYQMRILKSNAIPGLLGIKGRGMDGKTFYDYNVSGKISMQAMYERGKMSGRDMELLLKQLLAVVRAVEDHLLNIHRILVDPEFIFYEDETYYFCYYPRAQQDLWLQIHQLAEYLVKKADYDDKDCVRMIFILHKKTMEPNYSLEKVVRECMKNDEKREKFEGEMRRKNPGIYTMEYDTSEHDRIREQAHGSVIMEETENLWTPMKRFLNRKKKPKWGDWDGLYIEEEEL